MANAAYSCTSSIDCMHWSLKQSILHLHKGTLNNKICYYSQIQ